jgi:hypothetical protein
MFSLQFLQDPVVRAQAGKPSYGGGFFDKVCHSPWATQHGRSSKYKYTKDMVRVLWTEDGGFFKLPTIFSSMAV